MGSVINTPSPAVATAITTGGATETLVVTSNGVNLDSPEQIVLLEWSVDFLNSASGATITFKVERGSAAGGTLVSKASTFGPFDLTASKRSNWSGVAIDLPGACAGQVYTLTMTIASNAATATIETAVLAVQVQQAS